MSKDNLQQVEDLRALGALLHEAREERAYTLEEAEMRTRIRVKYLVALEQGDLSVLPSATHARGFLRNYAQFLQLDVDTIVDRFAALTGEHPGSVTTVTAEPRPPAPPPSQMSASPAEAPGSEQQAAPSPSPRRATYVPPSQRVGPSAPAGLAGQPGPSDAGHPETKPRRPGSGVFARPARRADKPPTARPVAPPEPAAPPKPGRFWQSNLFTAAVLLLGFIVIIWWSSTRLSTISVDQIVPTAEGSQLLEEFAASATAESTPTFAPTSTSLPQAGPQIFNRVLLTINVEQRSWVRITVDGEIVFQGQVVAGTILQYEGQETIVVRAGNAQALSVTYNGNDIGVLGERGEVVERTFTVAGQITPTSTPTVTNTPTLVPTATPRVSPTPSPSATTGADLP